MAFVDLKLTSELFDKLLRGTKRTTIRRRGKVKIGDTLVIIETIGDMWTIGREGHLMSAIANDLQPRTYGPVVATGVFKIAFSPDGSIALDDKDLDEFAIKALCHSEGLSKKDLFKFIQLTYGFEEPLEIIVIGRKKDN